MVQLQGGLAGAARVTELLHESPEQSHFSQDEKLNSSRIESEPVEVEFRETVFGYAASAPILNGMSFVIKKGQVAALVGASGGGKSTVIKLLLGFYKYQAGEILLNGQPLGNYKRSDLRDLFAYIPQDAHLFDGTILDNIRYGKLDATEEEVHAAAEAAIAHDFIASFPEGYRTKVGERGSRLSGGQKQRIAIARAFLKNAPIVILDEATSALDAESERLVHASLQRLMENRTAIVIAHRLSAIRKADLIYVVDNGKIVESGTHEELIVLQGAYFKLQNQSGAPDIHSAAWVTA